MSNSSLTAANFVALTDKLTAALIAGEGSSGSGFGEGITGSAMGSGYGVQRKLNDALGLVLAYADSLANNTVGNSLVAAVNSSGYSNVYYNRLSGTFTNLVKLIVAQGLTGVKSVNSFATYYNIGTGGPNNALLNPGFITLYSIIYTSLTLPFYNVYSPAIANMAQQVVGGAFTPGTGVNTSLYAGAALAQLVTTSFTGSSDTVTVTGTANVAGVITNGRTFTATVASSSTHTLTPTVAGDLLVSVSSIVAGASITASTAFQVVCAIPAGRSNPAT